ncbi:hypothetical protein V1512DRAFT_266664 [Lipomyces arxii]|uniref:uncharacterized protein n=1 Tax=Lipomyces arxii TaxID=56418 RepID=UPI0034CE2B47
MTTRHMLLLDVSRAIRATHEELLLWSLATSPSHSYGLARRSRQPSSIPTLISVLYPERTIVFLAKSAGYIKSSSERYMFGLRARRRHFSQTHRASKEKDPVVVPLRIPSQIADKTFWENPVHPRKAWTNSASQPRIGTFEVADSDNTPISYSKIPDDPGTQLRNLMRISAAYNVKLTDVAFQLWNLCIKFTATRTQLLFDRLLVFNYFRASANATDWQRLVLMVNDVPEDQLTELDYRYRLWALVQLNSSESVDKSFLECAIRFPNEMDTQWHILEQFHIRRQEHDDIFVMWCLMTANQDPNFTDVSAKTKNTIRQLFLRCSHHADAIGRLVNFNPLFGNKIARVAIQILGELDAANVAKDVFWNMHLHQYSYRDLTAVTRMLCRNNLAMEAQDLIAEYELKFPSSSSDNPLIGAKLETLAALEQFDDMQLLFDRTVEQGLATAFHYNITMHTLGGIGEVKIVDSLLEEMGSRNIDVTKEVIATVMWARIRVGDNLGAIELFDNLDKYRLEPDAVIYNLLMSAYSNRNDVSSMFEVFRRLAAAQIIPGKAHITTLMNRFAQRGEPEKVEIMFNLFHKLDIRPDAAAFNTLALAHVRSRKASVGDVAVDIFNRMRELDIVPNMRLFATLLAGFADMQNATGIREMISSMGELSVPMNEVAYGVMIHYLGNIDQVSAAEDVFNQLQFLNVKKTVFHYTALMNAYLRSKEFWKVGKTYSEMVQDGVSPSYVAMLMLLLSQKKYRGSGYLRFAESLIRNAPKIDLTLDNSYPKTAVPPFIFTALMQSYGLNRGVPYKQIVEMFSIANEGRKLKDQIPMDYRFDGFICLAAVRAKDPKSVRSHYKVFYNTFIQTCTEFDELTGTNQNRLANYDRSFVNRVIAARYKVLNDLDEAKQVETMWDNLARLNFAFNERCIETRSRALGRFGLV